MADNTRHLYQFGAFCVDTSEHLLFRDGKPLLLPPKAFDTLAVLVQNSGHTVGKDELMKAVWPDSFVEEANLTQNIFTLRKVLGEDPNGRQYIETIPKRGYRFAGPVQEVAESGGPTNDIEGALSSRTQSPGVGKPEASPFEQSVTKHSTTTSGSFGNATARMLASVPRSLANLSWIVVTILLFLVALAVALVHFRERPVEPRPVTFFITAPEKTAFAPSAPVISPDGTRLAFVTSSEGRSLLWIRPLDSLASQPLSGTEGAAHPFWSPDGRFIGFFAQQKLKKVEVSGGPVQTLCEAGFGVGGTWNRDDVIVFGSTSKPLYRVSAAGGNPTPLSAPDPSGRYSAPWWPHFLPDGRHFLYLGRSQHGDDSGIYVGILDAPTPSGSDAKENKRLVSTNAGTVYVPSPNGREGHLLFLSEGTLMAQPFDPNGLKIKGDPFPIAEQLGGTDTSGIPRFSASETGVLVYRAGGTGLTTRFVWFDRSGKELGSIGAGDEFSHPAISADGKRVAFELPDPKSGHPGIWMLDLSRIATSRLTFDPRSHKSPVWSADGSHVIFGSYGERGYQILQTPAAGTGNQELLVESRNWLLPTGVLDGRFLVYHEQDPRTNWDLWLLPLGDRKPVPFLQTPFSESHGQFSPDGQWMAYESNESGRWEVYVQSFPASGTKYMISTSGGVQPRWRRNGKELFYLTLEEKLMAVDVKAATALDADRPRVLFQTQGRGGSVGVTQRSFQYDVSSDGQRFLINTPAEEANASPITVVVNWKAKRQH